MGSKLGRVWKSCVSTETVEKFADASEKVFDLAETLNNEDNQKNPQIKELVEQIPTLLEALNSPIGQVIKSSVPFLPIATGMIQFAISINQKEPTIAETVAIALQAAYLESIRKTLTPDLIATDDDKRELPAVKQQLKQLANLEIEDDEARKALVCFHQSKLASAFNAVLKARLQAVGLTQSQVKICVQRVAINTQRYIFAALADSGEGIQKLINWQSIGGREALEKYQSIDTYLEDKDNKIPKPTDKVFQEQFSYQDIYVPLKAMTLDKNGEEIRGATDFVLDEWVQEYILNPKTAAQVIFIQAGAGRGKSVFCRMFAYWVKENLQPIFTPILIRLRDIEHFEPSFDKTLSDVLSYCDFVSSDSGWLTDRNTRYLFLLDGFDELRMEGRATGGIERFIEQVGRFQEKFRGEETGHRIIITGRPIALQGISYLPENLSRIKLLPMDDEIQQQWLSKWQQVVIPNNPDAAREETARFKDFLAAENCPREIKEELAREPLLLYLLAKLHREQAISKADFEQARDSTQARILIYQKSLEWVLQEQRAEWLQQRLTGLDTDNLERILIEAGLCVVQSGGEYARVEMIETRLAKDDSDAAETIAELRAKQGEKAIDIALGSFYIRPAGGKKGGGFEFYHKSFGEFLCAKRLLLSLEEWTETGKKRRKWTVDDKKLAEEIYDLLGYGGLSYEIVGYLRGLLIDSDEFRPVELFQRLEDFYWRWCDGEFIDAEGTTLPQTKRRELKQQLPARETYLGQRQVDIYAGLNNMILLLELHRYGQSQPDEIKQKLTFYPCGQPNAEGKLEDATLLKRLIHYSDCVGDDGFRDTLGRFFSGANLAGANLTSTDLAHANLTGANLYGANLKGANLTGASLYGANLTGAYLEGANLEGAYLAGANLTGANLTGAYLAGADLTVANLTGANLTGAYLDGAYLDGACVTDAYLVRANFVGADWSLD